MEWESKAQNFLVATIVVAIFAFLIGTGIGPMEDQKKIASGFDGFSGIQLKYLYFIMQLYRFSLILE